MSLKIFRSHEPKALLPLPEGPINALPPELVESCIFWTTPRDKDNTRLVSRSWNAITLKESKYPRQAELERFIRLLIENLQENHPRKSAKLTEIKRMLTSFSSMINPPSQTDRLFLITRQFVLGVLKSLSTTRRDQLQLSITPQVSPSLNALFELTKMTPDQAINAGDFDTFYMVLENSLPLSHEDHATCVITAADAGEVRMLRLMLAKQFLTIESRGTAVAYAARDNHQECVEVLLADGPISDQHRGQATESATGNDNIELARVILKSGRISQTFIGRCLALASRNKNPDFIQLLFSQSWTPEKKS